MPRHMVLYFQVLHFLGLHFQRPLKVLYHAKVYYQSRCFLLTTLVVQVEQSIWSVCVRIIRSF